MDNIGGINNFFPISSSIDNGSKFILFPLCLCAFVAEATVPIVPRTSLYGSAVESPWR